MWWSQQAESLILGCQNAWSLLSVFSQALATCVLSQHPARFTKTLLYTRFDSPSPRTETIAQRRSFHGNDDVKPVARLQIGYCHGYLQRYRIFPQLFTLYISLGLRPRVIFGCILYIPLQNQALTYTKCCTPLNSLPQLAFICTLC